MMPGKEFKEDCVQQKRLKPLMSKLLSRIELSFFFNLNSAKAVPADSRWKHSLHYISFQNQGCLTNHAALQILAQENEGTSPC